MAFIETPRFPESIQYGSQGGPVYATDIAATISGRESRNQNWTYCRYRYNANLVKTETDFETLLGFFHAMAGRLTGFRFKDWADYKSCGVSGTPANTDQVLGTGDGAEVDFQLVKNYAAGANTRARNIIKPVSGSVLVAVAGIGEANRFSVDTTTGIVTFSANQNHTVTAATNAASAVLTIGAHFLVAGDSVYLSGFAGGTWNTVNGNRYTVTGKGASTITINLDSTGLGAYTASSGSVDTIPQSGEAVTAGFEFDVPVRFDTDYLNTSWETCQIGALDVPLVEVRS